VPLSPLTGDTGTGRKALTPPADLEIVVSRYYDAGERQEYDRSSPPGDCRERQGADCPGTGNRDSANESVPVPGRQAIAPARRSRQTRRILRAGATTETQERVGR